MASETVRSPLSFVVLALLYEAPAHPYRIGQLIRERGKDRVVNVAQRNSVQQAVHRLARDGLIEAVQREERDRYPARVIYRITEAGTGLLLRWLTDMVARPAAEYPRFPAALSFLALTDPGTVTRLLESRRDALIARRDGIADSLAATSRFLARVLLIEDEYTLAMTQAELAWVEALLAELRAGTITWDTKALVASQGRISEPFDGGPA